LGATTPNSIQSRCFSACPTNGCRYKSYRHAPVLIGRQLLSESDYTDFSDGILVRRMTSRVLPLLFASLFMGAASQADPAPQPTWEKKAIKGVLIDLPTNCKMETQTMPGNGVVQNMTKFSFRNNVLDLELVFLSFPGGTVGNLDKAAENTSSEIKRTSGEESLTR
jgi:hypothetical protein